MLTMYIAKDNYKKKEEQKKKMNETFLQVMKIQSQWIFCASEKLECTLLIIITILLLLYGELNIHNT